MNAKSSIYHLLNKLIKASTVAKTGKKLDFSFRFPEYIFFNRLEVAPRDYKKLLLYKKMYKMDYPTIQSDLTKEVLTVCVKLLPTNK